MGRQIIFCMDREHESIFFDYLKANCKISDGIKGDQLNYVDTIQEQVVSQETENTVLYLYKPEFGVYNLDTTENGRIYIDTYSSPIIEFVRTLVLPDIKMITSGRLYVVAKYYDMNDNLQTKHDGLLKLYNKLCRWIRKNLQYHEYFNPYTLEYVNRMNLEYGIDKGYITKDYISDSLLALINEEGYHTN